MWPPLLAAIPFSLPSKVVTNRLCGFHKSIKKCCTYNIYSQRMLLLVDWLIMWQMLLYLLQHYQLTMESIIMTKLAFMTKWAASTGAKIVF